MDEKKVREAIEDFRLEMQTYENMISYCEQFEPKTDCRSYKEIVAMYKTATEALEKQLPKKAKENEIRGGWLEKQKHYTCPNCGNCLLTEMMNERQNTSYCWGCGQRLDW